MRLKNHENERILSILHNELVRGAANNFSEFKPNLFFRPTIPFGIKMLSSIMYILIPVTFGILYMQMIKMGLQLISAALWKIIKDNEKQCNQNANLWLYRC